MVRDVRESGPASDEGPNILRIFFPARTRSCKKPGSREQPGMSKLFDHEKRNPKGIIDASNCHRMVG
ncbi:hypothetical protein ZHAS_00014759 [Anopheles sinensis]|uniref:Uncharacterized protein n=1 Tax=Anopheles sinensis TaxID=74873 RepID=A0A084W964_ANOSI|nr:hypothetical protein ZHAS_00014759 [Anopheles sinensis]